MKNLKYILIATIFMFVGINEVSAKKVVKECEYKLYDSLSGHSSESVIKIYEDNTAQVFNNSFVITVDGKLKDISSDIKTGSPVDNWDDVKSTFIQTNKCPSYAAVRRGALPSYTIVSYNRNSIVNYLTENNALDQYSHIVSATEHNSDPQVNEQYYNQMMTESENILKTTESFNISECKDESKDITAYAKCNDQYDRIKIRINNFELNLNTYISQNYISEDDQRTKQMRKNIEQAELNLVDIKYAIDNKQEIVTPDYKHGCEIFGDTLVELIHEIYGYFKWIIPVLIVVLSMLDFVKVVGTGKDEDFKKAQNNLIKRIIIGVVFFLIPTIISMAINFSGITEQIENGNSIIDAVTCILK